MKEFRIIIPIIFVFFMFSSCDDFLDINPEGEVVNDDMFNTQDGIENAVYGVYGALKSASLYGANLSFTIPEFLASNLNASGITAYQPFMEFDYLEQNAESQIRSVWADAYEAISYCNNIIENLEGINPEAYELYDLYMGEMYGVRGLLHFELVQYFAPHIEESPGAEAIPYSEDYSFEFSPFYSVSEVYERIISDLLLAQELLADDVGTLVYPRRLSDEEFGFREDRTTHFNYYAATAILARAYWMMGDYEKASEEAYKVIDSGVFPLATEDKIQALIPAKFSGEETIFGVFSEEFTNDAESYFLTAGGISYYGAGAALLQGKDDIYDQYKSESGQSADRRNTDWFGEFLDADGIVRDAFIKHVDLARIYNNQRNDYDEHYGITVIRIPEMYYIAAEFAIRSGNTAGATTLLNAVLDSRGIEGLDTREPEPLIPTLDFLYNERHKEFFGEGRRWFDMKKQNMDIISNEQYETLAASNEYYVFPIPEEEYIYR